MYVESMWCESYAHAVFESMANPQRSFDQAKMAKACVVVVVLAAVTALAAAQGSCSDQAGNPCNWVNSCDTCDRMAFSSLVMHAITGAFAHCPACDGGGG
jgi:hypothetical protein